MCLKAHKLKKIAIGEIPLWLAKKNWDLRNNPLATPKGFFLGVCVLILVVIEFIVYTFQFFDVYILYIGSGGLFLLIDGYFN